MSVFDLIRARRSVKRFTDEPVGREEIERLLEAVVYAPNHRMTEPWRFYVLGPDARAAYGRALGLRKARRVDDPAAAEEVVRKVETRNRELPAMIAVAIVRNENPEIHQEDFASAWMGVQNLSLLAHEMGLGTHIKTGAIMDDPNARAAAGVAEEERIVAVLEVGRPAETPEPKPRKPASEWTTWVP